MVMKFLKLEVKLQEFEVQVSLKFKASLFNQNEQIYKFFSF